MKGLFVTGTNTDIGKTITSAVLCEKACSLGSQVKYIKPVQTNQEEDCDATKIKNLVTYPSFSCDTLLKFNRPLSPHLSAHYDNTKIIYDDLLEKLHQSLAPVTVIEGAGGVLVPLGFGKLMIDLIADSRFPVLVVAQNILGTINHTLLTLEALKNRDIAIAGVLLWGENNLDNNHSIREYGKLLHVTNLPFLEHITQASIKARSKELPEWLSEYVCP